MFTLTGILAEIEQAAGREAALAIAAQYGGQAVYIVGTIDRLRDDGWLVQCVGRAAAEKIVEKICASYGLRVSVPSGPMRAFKPVIMIPLRDRAASIKRTSGSKSAKELASLHNVSMRTIHRWRAEARRSGA